MSKPRGNPNWGKPQPLQQMLGATGFEQAVRALRLSPDQYRDSPGLKDWVCKNKDSKYVPLDLLQAWGLTVKTGS